jgi:uncharacterized protein YjdB
VLGGGGLATGLAAGSVTITAIYTPSDGSTTLSATAALTVTAAKTPKSLTLSPSSASILLNGTQAFTATLVYTDGSASNVTNSASWTTTDPTVVVLSNANTGGRGGGGGIGIVGGGTATGVGTGTATVTASYTDSGTTFSATANVTVSNPAVLSFSITPTTPTIYLSGTTTQQVTATVIFTDDTKKDVTTSSSWTSGTPAVAVIGGNNGRAQAVSAGSSIITATYTDSSGTVHTATTTLTVASRKLSSLSLSPTTPTTHVGFTKSFTLYAIYDDGSKSNVTGSATWSSSTASVATIAINGGGPGGGGNTAVSTAIAAGSTTIQAAYGGLNASTTLTVSSGTLSSIAVTGTSASIAVGATEQLTATGTYSDNLTEDLTSSAIWLSSSDASATVSNATASVGLLTAVAAGSPAISAVYKGVTGTLSIQVTSN